MNKKLPRRALLPVVVTAASHLAGCATISPPPAAMALEGASQGPVGSTSVTAFGGASAGVFVDGSLGGGARIAHRVSREIAFGVDGVAGAAVDPHSNEPSVPRALYAGRAHLQANPGGSEHVAFVVGAGGGATNHGLAYVTADVSARVSTRVARGLIEPYAAGLVAVSLPMATPDAAARGDSDRRFLTTTYFGGDVGVAFHPAPRLDVALDVLAVGAYSAANSTLLLVPTVGLRYSFGGEGAQ